MPNPGVGRVTFFRFLTVLARRCPRRACDSFARHNHDMAATQRDVVATSRDVAATSGGVKRPRRG